MVVLMLGTLIVSAQSQVTGTVTDSKTGLGVANVTVGVKGGTASTQTGTDGFFKLNVPANTQTLVFSSVGFATQEVAVNGRSSLTVSLVQTEQKLDEVVVVAYGTRRKSDLTSAAVSVGTKDFQKGNITSSEQLLQGKVAGLEITNGGGYAGGGSKIRIRGISSLIASQDPLIVIDDVPVDNNSVSGTANILSTINPNDIESMTVLKDAAAASLYGSRASNGVIIITTKKGRAGKPVFNFNTKLSLAAVSKYNDVLSPQQVRDIVNSQATLTGSDTYSSLLGTANTDWQKLIFKKALTTDNNLSIAGAIKASKISIPYRISLGYLYQEGILKTNKFDRTSASLNLTPKFLDDHLAVSVNVRYSHIGNKYADDNSVRSAVSFDPTQNPYNDNPKTGGYYEWMSADDAPIGLATRNPLALLNLRDNTSKVNRLLGNISLDYKLHFFPDLHIRANFGMDNIDGEGNDNISPLAASQYNPDKPEASGRYSFYKQGKRNYLTDVSLFYEKKFGKGNNIDVLALHSYQDFYTNVYNYPSYRANGDTIFETVPRFATDKPENRIESYLGRVNLTLFDAVLLSGSIRRDASAKFSKDNRVGYFPAGSIALKLQELLFKNSNIVNELKLRFGAGTTGQQDGIDNYKYLPVYGLSYNNAAQYQFGDVFVTYLRPQSYFSDLKWETTTSTNVGLDFAFAKNRISGSVDVYNKKTKNLLSIVPIAPGANFESLLLVNVGDMKTKGAEFTLNLIPVKTKDLTWELGGNVGYNENKITKLLLNPDPNFKGVDVGAISGGTGNYIAKYAVGYAAPTFYVYKQIYDKETGKPIEGLYEDINRDGIITEDDKYFYKKPSPDYTYGISTTVTYKNFSLGLAGHGSTGNYLYNNFASGAGVLNSIQNPLGFVGNASTSYLKTGFKNNQYFSDYYIENASFFRLDNINLGYNFGKLISKNTNLRVTANVQNVFVITKYSGADPENSGIYGTDNLIYPRPRVYTLGASLDF